MDFQAEAAAALLAASTTPQHHHVAEDENENEEELTNGDAGGDVSRDLDTDEHIKDPIEDRRTLAERNERLHDQLKVGRLILIARSTKFHSLDCVPAGPETGSGAVARRDERDGKRQDPSRERPPGS